MLQVQRHFHPGSSQLLHLCKASRELYNRCNFLMRKSWFDNCAAKKNDPKASWKPQPGLPELVNELGNLDCFKALHNTKTAKQTIRKCVTDWSNFRAALKAYNKDPSSSSFARSPRTTSRKSPKSSSTTRRSRAGR